MEHVHELDEWQTDLEHHLRQCNCTCNHMGYGNYWTYHHKENLNAVPGQTLVTELDLPPWESFHRAEHHDPHHHHHNHLHAHPLPPGPLEPILRGQNGTVPDIQQNDSDSTSRSSKTDLGGKQWCILCIVLMMALATGVGVGVPLALRSGASMEERLAIVKRILEEVPLIDGHNDLPWNIRKFAGGRLSNLNLSGDLRSVEPWSRSPWSHTDLPRLREGRVGAQFWAAFVPCGAQFLDAVKLTLEQIDLIKRLVAKYPAYLKLAVDAQGIEDAHRDGKIASLIGIEGGHSIGNSLGVLRILYELGARYMTLTSTCSTPWADCSFAETDSQHLRHGGLTAFGKLMIKEMNRLGMIVDLAHVSLSTMHDAITVSKAPVIVSHSSARALCNTSRNVPDEVLHRITNNGGLVMVNFFTHFITCNKTATLQDVIAHINHIRQVAGIDHVGLGAGYDGINSTPRGLEDVSRYPYLLAELLKDANWSIQDVKKLAGLNFLRIFREVEKVRDEWKKADVLPEEATISMEDIRGHTQCTYLGL